MIFWLYDPHANESSLGAECLLITFKSGHLKCSLLSCFGLKGVEMIHSSSMLSWNYAKKKVFMIYEVKVLSLNNKMIKSF